MEISSSPSPNALSGIIITWPIVEAYVDLESTISAAQTCRALHQTIIDPNTLKVKVSHFAVCSYPSAPTSPLAPLSESDRNHWKASAERIPHFVSRALNAIHFPSLYRLDLDFPLTKRRNASGHAEIIEDVCNCSFPIFVTNLAYASNLEQLQLNASRFMAIERSGQLEGLYENFGSNLSKCKKLKEIELINSGVGRSSNDWLYSVALLRALLPTLEKRRKDLHTLDIYLAGTPSDPLHERYLSTRGIDTALDFFVRVLSLERLTTLGISITDSNSHLSALIEAAMQLSSNVEIRKPTFINSLRISFTRVGTLGRNDISPELRIAAPLLDFFSQCDNLKNVFLEMPSECWDGGENIQALSNLLRNKVEITSLTISFSCCPDRNGKILGLLADFLVQSNSNNVALSRFSIFGILNADKSDVDGLKLLLDDAGMSCTKYLLRESSIVGRTNVMIVEYSRER
mmetsp:Transcript_10875/g.23018  ORF Transcript_10875/g.23018 Transcript_10875/m.23018 type:complete len:459 (+) Transcript_10875:83-1459(+)